MPVIERDVVMQSVDEDGRPTIDLPITRLGNVEDTAEVKETPGEGDYFPIMDGAEGGQMKKAPLRVILEPLGEAKAAAEAAQKTAAEAATMKQVEAAVQAAVLDSWEGSY